MVEVGTVDDWTTLACDDPVAYWIVSHVKSTETC
jgi:hypothetical protein